MIPPAQRCEEILKGPNFDVPERWVCPVCDESGIRAHWIAEHALEHMRKGDNKPQPKPEDNDQAKEAVKQGVRALELD